MRSLLISTLLTIVTRQGYLIFPQTLCSTRLRTLPNLEPLNNFRQLRTLLLAPIYIDEVNERCRKADKSGKKPERWSNFARPIDDSANNSGSEDTGPFVGNGVQSVECSFRSRWDEFTEEGTA